MLSFVNLIRYAKLILVECRYAEYHTHVIRLIVCKLDVVMPSVIRLKVVAPNGVDCDRVSKDFSSMSGLKSHSIKS